MVTKLIFQLPDYDAFDRKGRPLKLCRLWIDCSGGIFTMALTFSGSGLRPSGVSLCPKNLQSIDLNCILSGLSERLFILAVSNRVSSLPSCCTSVSPCVSMSSAMP